MIIAMGYILGETIPPPRAGNVHDKSCWALLCRGRAWGYMPTCLSPSSIPVHGRMIRIARVLVGCLKKNTIPAIPPFISVRVVENGSFGRRKRRIWARQACAETQTLPQFGHLNYPKLLACVHSRRGHRLRPGENITTGSGDGKKSGPPKNTFWLYFLGRKKTHSFIFVGILTWPGMVQIVSDHNPWPQKKLNQSFRNPVEYFGAFFLPAEF